MPGGARPCKKAGMTSTGIAIVLVLGITTGCGAESVGAAAAGAAIKKQELQQGQQTLDQAKQKIGQAVELQHQRGAQE